MTVKFHEQVRTLIDQLGPTLVQVMTGVKDRRLPYRWQIAAEELPDESIQERIACAYEAWNILSAKEGPNVTAALFIGSHSQLDDGSLVLGIREGKFSTVIGIAQRLASGEWMGN